MKLVSRFSALINEENSDGRCFHYNSLKSWVIMALAAKQHRRKKATMTIAIKVGNEHKTINN